MGTASAFAGGMSILIMAAILLFIADTFPKPNKRSGTSRNFETCISAHNNSQTLSNMPDEDNSLYQSKYDWNWTQETYNMLEYVFTISFTLDVLVRFIVSTS